MPAPGKADAARRLTELLAAVALGVAALILIHQLPKGVGPRLRFGYTVGYFATLGGLGYLLLGPRRRALEAAFAWVFDEAPSAMERAWRRYLHALDRLVTAVVGLALAFVAAVGVRVLALWYPALDPLTGIAWLVLWVALATLLLLPLAGGFLFQDVFQRLRALHEQVGLTVGYRPRGWAELFGPTDPSAPVPLAVAEGLAFAAGGRTWRWDDLRTSCAVFGQPGSGKTSCVLNTLLDGLLGSAHRAGVAPAGLILDPKGDFRDKVRVLAGRYGWERHLVVIDPDRPDRSARWNPLDSADDELELAARFAAVLEALGQKAGDTSFWIDSARKFLRHAIALVRLTNPPDEPPCFADLLRLATSFDAIAERTDRLTEGDPKAEACLGFFADEWADLAAETRSGIQAQVTNMLDPFLVEPYRTLFAGKSTVRVEEVVRRGLLLYVHMPVADKELMARTVGTFVKLEFFREVLKAVNKDRPSLFLCDEFQVFFTTGHGKGDAEFFERSRQSNHVNLIATQNLPALLRQSKGHKEPALSLLGNCATKVFLRNTDKETNEYASDLFGQEIVALAGSTTAAGTGRVALLTHSTTTTDQYDKVVRPERFAELAVPAAGGPDYCEAVVHAAGTGEGTGRRKQKWLLHPID